MTEERIKGKITKVYSLDCGYYEVVNGEGKNLKSPFFIGANGLDIVFYDEKKEIFGDSTNCKLYSVCVGWDITTKSELNPWNDLYISQVESTVNEDWIEL